LPPCVVKASEASLQWAELQVSLSPFCMSCA
jgi:hypothetical protein